MNSDGTVKLTWEAKSSTGKTLITSKVRTLCLDASCDTSLLPSQVARIGAPYSRSPRALPPTSLPTHPACRLQMKMEKIVMPDGMVEENETIDDVGASE